ncbi:hypothetical protein [Blastococcus sp. TF02A-26]|uniref:hypothetical protein n=1 Tax=Blastococcus sp. TF02A-26 TaxID=2250577 RepID=UPI000DE9625A|nr:hypothetical protein [Blastococcus sp. TF02A-26]RBY88260.1 hypothetical protein DQ240_05340 [Blastococcus sp. TF02A-26]
MTRLSPADVACWVVKSSRPPEQIDPAWEAGSARRLDRCLRRSYRLDLMRAGDPCLLWVSGRTAPGVHAVGVLADGPAEATGGPEVALDLTLLADPVPRAELLADPVAAGAEVLRMPAGSNPSWLSPDQFAVVRARVALPSSARDRLGPWLP